MSSSKRQQITHVHQPNLYYHVPRAPGPPAQTPHPTRSRPPPAPRPRPLPARSPPPRRRHYRRRPPPRPPPSPRAGPTTTLAAAAGRRPCRAPSGGGGGGCWRRRRRAAWLCFTAPISVDGSVHGASIRAHSARIPLPPANGNAPFPGARAARRRRVAAPALQAPGQGPAHLLPQRTLGCIVLVVVARGDNESVAVD